MMKRILVLLVAAGLIASCAHVPPMPPPPPSNCSGAGTGDRDTQKPVGCISVYSDALGFGGLLINPLVMRATRKEQVTLRWETRTRGEDLTITMKSRECTEEPVCKGRGVCQLRVRQGVRGGETCRYEIAVRLANGQTLTLDPIVKIDTD